MATDPVEHGSERAVDLERKQRLKDEFIRNRGYFDEIWDEIIELDLDFFEQYERFSSVPWQHGAIDRKTKELIAIALNASVTHMYLPGVRAHIRQALKFGATRDEIMEVFQLVSVLGVHSLTVGLPIFVDELHRATAAEGGEDSGAGGGEDSGAGGRVDGGAASGAGRDTATED